MWRGRRVAMASGGNTGNWIYVRNNKNHDLYETLPARRSFRFRRSLGKIRLNVATPVDELTAKQHGDRNWEPKNCSTKN
jgi:hypothetical protein